MSLKRNEDRIIVKLDLQGKNWHTFANGTVIRLERQWNNLNKRHTEPVNAEVVDGGYIPAGSLILIHHNASHDVYRIFNYQQASGSAEANSVKYYSIPENQCYAWHDGSTWNPLRGFEFGLRIFKPHEGKLQWVAPKLLKNTLYITSGKLKGKVVHTLKHCDYEIIFQDLNGQENRIVRCRHWEGEENEMEEIVAYNPKLTNEVYEEKLMIGIAPSDAKTLQWMRKN